MSAQIAATTLTTLLDSLHAHLQAQTELLPVLHSHLGLPPSALEDDLKTLQEELFKGVENQVQMRQKQVEEWMNKCEEMENECIRFSKALGGNMKSTGSCVGEIRKESVLPRRYDLLTEHQEKLRQVYHSKLEQLFSITNRLHSLAQTLGSAYFGQETLEPTVASGESPTDSNAKLDVSPERFLRLEKELVRGKAEVGKRLTQLAELFIQIDWLYSELGIIPPTLGDLGSASGFQSNATHSSHHMSPTSSDPFIDISPGRPSARKKSSTPLLCQDSQAELSETRYQRIFARFVVRMEEADNEALPEPPNIPFGLENVEPTSGLLLWAQNLHFDLEDLKKKREAHIQAMYDQLEGLWRRLGVEEADMDAFVENHRGSTEVTVREYEEELERMLELRKERMSTFVESARQEIVKLWDDLMVGEEDRADFAPFVDDEHTEELLTIHEDEIRRLREERRMKAPLLASIRKYFEVCEEEKELALAAADQSRLLGRGPRDPGRLLREEKMRKRVSKEKPRLEQDLLRSISAWEEETGRPFLINGESFLQILMETVAAADQENRRKPPRAVSQRATTPVNSIMGHLQGSRTGVVTPAIRPSPAMSSHSLPNKRQKLTESVRTGHGVGQVPSFEVGRAPLGDHKRINSHGRPPSPSKIPNKAIISIAPLPRSKSATVVVPRSATQPQVLGNGKLPGSVGIAARSVSASCKGSLKGTHGRYNSSKSVSGLSSSLSKKASRAKRESFKPRPSMDATGLDVTRGVGLS